MNHKAYVQTLRALSLENISKMLKPSGVLCLTSRKHGNAPPLWLPNPFCQQANEAELLFKLLNIWGFDSVNVDFENAHSQVIVAKRKN